MAIDSNHNITLDAARGLLNSKDDLMALGHMGRQSSSIYRAMRYMNHRNTALYVPPNRETKGLVFFTRPDLNLTRLNIIRNRMLATLLDDDPGTMGWFVRATLDPASQYDQNPMNMTRSGEPNDHGNNIPCDPLNCFIPVLSNTLLTMPGLPNNTLNSYTGATGLKGEEITFADGNYRVRGAFDLSLTFRNIRTDVIPLLFTAWCEYEACVSSGNYDMMPHWWNLFSNRIDYQTRIYRLVLDEDMRYVLRIAAVNAAFPIEVPTGNMFDYDRHSTPISKQADELTINFRASGVIYNDPFLIMDFNKIVATFNNGMLNSNRHRILVQIPYSLLDHFNYTGYPRIDPNTMELQWWVYVDSKQKDAMFRDNLDRVKVSIGDVNPDVDRFLSIVDR